MDPFILFHMLQNGYTPEQLKTALEKESGLKGISGLSGDLRDLQKAAAEGHARAALAIEIYCREIARYIGGAAQPGQICEVSGEDSRIRVFVIPANEELGVARKTYAALHED